MAVGLAAAAGVGVGATALAGAATGTAVPASASTTTTTPPGHFGPGRVGGRFHAGFVGPGGVGGPGGLGGFGGGIGPVLHGRYTVQGPNGYETLDERTGTVSAVSDTSGSTWSLTVKSADGTSETFTVGSGTSVNGGESGIASVKVGDTVDVVATVSAGTSTATRISDTTILQANGQSWFPAHPPASSSGGSAGTGSTTAPSPA